MNLIFRILFFFAKFLFLVVPSPCLSSQLEDLAILSLELSREVVEHGGVVLVGEGGVYAPHQYTPDVHNSRQLVRRLVGVDYLVSCGSKSMVTKRRA